MFSENHSERACLRRALHEALAAPATFCLGVSRTLTVLLIALAVLVQAIAEERVAFEPDANFHPVMATSEGVQVQIVLPQPSGRILVGGSFNSVSNVPANGVMRIDSNGNIDGTFKCWPGTRGAVLAAASLADGRIVLGGRFAEFSGESRTSLVRLKSDGSLDPGFSPSIDGDQSEVRVIRVQADGRLLIGGRFKSISGVPRSCIARLTPEGELDETFDPGQGAEDSFAVVYDLAIQDDGRILVAGAFTKFAGENREGVVRLFSDGTVDEAFQTEVKWSPGLAYVRALEIDGHGRVLMSGRFDSVNGQVRRGLARLLPGGELDLAFDTAEGVDGPGEPIATVLRVTASGQIIVGGRFSSIGNVARSSIARLNEDGLVDEKFDPGAGFTDDAGMPGVVNDLAFLDDGSLVVVGGFSCFRGERCLCVMEITQDGLPDPRFSVAGLQFLKVGYVNSIARSQDGGFVAGGSFELVDGSERRALARFTASGKLDPEFSAAFAPHSIVHAILGLDKGQLLVGGEFEVVAGVSRINIARLDADGTLDAEFDAGSGPNGPVYALALQPAGSALVGGAFTLFGSHVRLGLARVDWSGAIDPLFDPVITYRGGAGEVYAILVQSDGRIVIGGFFDSVNGSPCDSLARLMPNGDLDPDFGGGLHIGGRTVQILAIVPQKDGGILIAGAFENINGQPRSGIARLEADGSLDAQFVPGLGVGGGDLPIVYSVQPYAEKLLLLAGEFSSYDSVPHSNIVQTGLDGHLPDPSATSCSKAGTDGVVNTLLVQKDGGVLVGGGFTRIGFGPVHGLARLKPVFSSPVTLRIELEPGGPVLRWNGVARLQMCRALTESWEEVVNSAPPYRVPAGHSHAFFRLVQ